MDVPALSPLRRAWASRSSTLSPLALLQATTSSSTTPSESVATFACQQQFLQEVKDVQEAFSLSHVGGLNYVELAETNRDIPQIGGHGVDVDRLITELYELQQGLGHGDLCVSTTEQRYLSALHHAIVLQLTLELRALNPPVNSVKDICRALVTLSVKPTSLARGLAFSLMHDVVRSVTVQSASSSTTQTTNSHSTQLQGELFVCMNDMLIKSVAVAGTVADDNSRSDNLWMVPATACLLLLTRSHDGNYRVDRLRRLDASTLVFLTKCSCSPTTAGYHDAELQETLTEVLISAMYAHRSRTSDSTSRGSVSSLDVERFGGVDHFLAIFFTTTSSRTRRQLLVVIFDVVMDQVRRSKPREDETDSWASYESLLRCLQDIDFANIASTTPTSLMSDPVASARRVKILHEAVENELLEKHVAQVWAALYSTLQLDEYFAVSTALAQALKLLAATKQQPQHSHESIGEMIVARVGQLLLSSRPDERFKGERWLAELLSHGLYGDATAGDNNASHERTTEKHSLLGIGTNNNTSKAIADEQLEESLCYDEAAGIRLAAREKLWELSRSPYASFRLAFAHVLSLFTRRRARTGTHRNAVTALIRELNPCLDALVTQQEDSPTVIITMLDTVFQISTAASDVPYLDVRRQRYDTDSSDRPQELVGVLVGSESLATMILRGNVSVNRNVNAEVSLSFLVHALDVLDASMCQRGPRDGNASCALRDYAVATAVLISYALEDSVAYDDHQPLLAPFIDASDPRVAVLAARFVITHAKRVCGEKRYLEMLREIHAKAVESDDETPLANSVAHARALLDLLRFDQLTP